MARRQAVPGIKIYDLDMIDIAGPGHEGEDAPGVVANTYLEGSYTETYPNVSQDEAGLRKLFMQFSFPGGISSHVAPATPGSILDAKNRLQPLAPGQGGYVIDSLPLRVLGQTEGLRPREVFTDGQEST